MQYIVIPTNSKSEAAFFLDLLKKLRKEVSTLSAEEMEDTAFIAALKSAEQSGKGSLKKVKAHLYKLTSGR